MGSWVGQGRARWDRYEERVEEERSGKDRDGGEGKRVKEEKAGKEMGRDGGETEGQLKVGKGKEIKERKLLGK